MSRISAIIPSLIDVDKEYLQLCISSLRDSGFTGDIIVVANGTKDMAPFRDVTGMTKAIHTRQQGQCAAVNAGASLAEGDCEYLFVINSDMYFAPDWDKNLDWDNLPLCCSPNLVEPTNNPGSAPPFLKFDGGFTLDEFNREAVDKNIQKNIHDLQDAHLIEDGFNLPFIINRELWNKVSGYDEAYDPWSSNSDTDLQTKINFAGVVPVRLRNVLVYHFSNKSGTFDGTHQDSWQKNWDYFDQKWGFNRDVLGSDVWYNKDMLPQDKSIIKFKADWENFYASDKKLFNLQ